MTIKLCLALEVFGSGGGTPDTHLLTHVFVPLIQLLALLLQVLDNLRPLGELP